MPKSPPFIRDFHDPRGFEVKLTCDDEGCMLEIRGREGLPSPTSVQILTVIHDEWGLPDNKMVIACEPMRLTAAPDQNRKIGRIWLPGSINRDWGPRLYFRLILEA